MGLGPTVPANIAQLREKRFKKTDINEDKPKMKQLFDPTKSINNELKNKIMSNVKSVKDRFE